ncbi:dephospho-CoA kinase [Flavobacterium sp. 316]|uniref:Dephospho-CoA kinase n=1 Tax=Flavobacterium sediminilitoris TaxID=2024526 RepID=A0ABY4HMW0_9FLAO|nr:MULTISPECIES: dephospho-CoA kinase [Flavobacterium]KIX22491.1 dephospho-CoA kinase [Flavobacterium sp. 316]UOX33577.1 dephospho-CoA kinase [Flavobacterium sediminilitoris]
MTKIIGLTGGIGSGKSTVAKYIASKNIPVYIADDEAKKIMDDENVVVEVQLLFEENILNDKHKLDRKKIASIVFQNPEKLNQLNQLIHPKVKQHFKDWLKTHKNAPFIIKEVAILFETGGDKECDKVILITAPENVKMDRIMKRDNIDKNEILKRMKNQLSDDEKSKKSDFIVQNINLNDTFLEIDKILKILKIS